MKRYLIPLLVALSVTLAYGVTTFNTELAGKPVASSVASNDQVVVVQSGATKLVAKNVLLSGLTSASQFTNISSATQSKLNKKADLYSKNDLFYYMDGQSGRPSLATWQLNPTTTSVSSVFQAAVNGCGGLLIIPAGEFNVSTQVNLPSTIHIIGAGKATHIFNTTGSYNNAPNMLVATSQHDITVEQVWVENSHYGIAFPPAGTFPSTMGINLLFIDCDRVTVTNCYASGGGGYIGGNDQGVAPVYFSKCRNVIASGNTVWDSQNGILADDWYSGTTSATRGLVFASNTISDVGRTSIVVDLAGGGTATITGNSCRQFTQQAMEINNVSTVTITGNTIDGEPTGRTQSNVAVSGSTSTYGLRGIFINEISTLQTRNLVVTGNAISNILYTPIQAYDVLNADISHNPIYNFTGDATSAPAAGIRLYSSTASRPFEKVSISHNIISAAPASGATVDGIIIDIFDASTAIKNVSVSHNTITGVNHMGIYKKFVGTSNIRCSVLGNTISGATDGVITGIYWNGIINGRMSENLTSKCSVGINVLNSSFTTFDNTHDGDSTGMNFVNSTRPVIKSHFLSNTTAAMTFSGTNLLGNAMQAVFTTDITTIKSGVPTANGARVLLYLTAAPSGTNWEAGDRVQNVAGTVGQPKAWTWSGAAWTSEGNL